MSTPQRSTAAADGRHVMFAGALLATYMQAVNISVPNAALPHIQATLSMANDEVGWVFSSYIAASAVTMSVTQWLATRYGRKAVYQTALAIFALGLTGNDVQSVCAGQDCPGRGEWAARAVVAHDPA
ncbi:MFS transporter [Bradyrhizobium sp. CCBAU 45384]|uniref:MFS transporter n=1 Tax=Bradyrhizobium sp. CCBAU 45384 TaxID=858428 RepID=UPI002306677B|nr:MFS transporter [Bradyrhizobium sp. CCBAU 45384]